MEVLINIFTDKAANPTSVLGRTKRLAERLTAAVGSKTGGRFVSVCFGNVLGSRGSMITTFKHQISHGRAVTVTHPDIACYFMTIYKACSLVIPAGAIGHSGEVLILDMGEPIRVLDVANRMIKQSGQHIGINFTGLLQGEKLCEGLIAEGETDQRPFHPRISHVAVDALDLQNLVSYHAWAVKGFNPLK